VSATIEDVARRASVSVATVSRALRGLPNVAPSTRDRVVGAARELQYVADPAASRLAGRRALRVGLLVPDLGSWYHAQLLTGVEGVLAGGDCDLLPFSLASTGGIERFLDAWPFLKRVDGLIVADGPIEDAQVERVADAGVALVTAGVLIDETPGLAIDNAAAVRRAVSHLVGLGHRRIAWLGGVRPAFGGRVASELVTASPSVGSERFRGFLDGLAAAGVVPEPRLLVPTEASFDGGADAMHRLLALAEPPTAVVAHCDPIAIGAMQVARDAGLAVPGGLSIVGIDDHDVSAHVGLTTIAQDPVSQGAGAARILVDYLTEGSAEVVHEIAPVRLVVRRTTGIPSARGVP
jgi:LacI family transcriptional regulator, repressor for deo operon, udp, cdd, tsx, nupC, and nupG